MGLGALRQRATVHHSRKVIWSETASRIAGLVDGFRVTIQKMHKTTFQPSRGGKLAKKDAPRYRVLVDGVFVAPGWGFRRTLKAAKDDGVLAAILCARRVKDARTEFKAAVLKLGKETPKEEQHHSQSQARERSNGMFGFQGDWNRLCVCGHELGFHTAEAPHDCMNSDRLSIGSGGGLDPKRFPATDCECKRFRLSRRKQKPMLPGTVL